MIFVSVNPFAEQRDSRSGIGSAKVLNEVGVPVKVDLPGVGENYQGKCSTLIKRFA